MEEASRGEKALLLVFLALSFGAFFYFANVRNFHDFLWDCDVHHWYAGGKCLWVGVSPYDRDAYAEVWIAEFGVPPGSKGTFVYPPTMALIGLPLALIPWSAAPWVFRFVSLAALIGICYMTLGMMGVERAGQRAFYRAGWYIGLCGYLASITQCVTQGQIATVVVFGCVAVWYGLQRRLFWLFIAGFALASIKPQISMLPLLYVLFIGGWRWFLFGAGACSLFSAIFILMAPIPNVMEKYQGSMENHLRYQDFNHWSGYCGVPALLGDTPLGGAAMIGGIVAGILAVAWVGWRKGKIPDTVLSRIRHGQMVWVIAFATMPIHVYDLVGQAYVALTLWALPGWRRRAVALLCMLTADRMYGFSRLAEIPGGFISSLSPYIYLYGTSTASGVLLILFLWWYWKDYSQEEAPLDGVPQRP